MENSLRKLTSYSQGCMEIILKWRDIFGVYVIRDRARVDAMYLMGVSFHQCFQALLEPEQIFIILKVKWSGVQDLICALC